MAAAPPGALADGLFLQLGVGRRPNCVAEPSRFEKLVDLRPGKGRIAPQVAV